MNEDEYIKRYEKYLAGQCTPEEEAIIKTFQDDFSLKDRPWDARHVAIGKKWNNSCWSNFNTGCIR